MLIRNSNFSPGVIDDDGNLIRCKILELGEWNMNLTRTLFVTHGLGSNTLILSATCYVRWDSDSRFAENLDRESQNGLNVHTGSILSTSASFIQVERVDGGYFDNLNFENLGFNRGIIVVFYVSDYY